MSTDRVFGAYTRRATEYIEVLGSIDRAAQQDRDYLLSWADSVDGLILDVGCGPGQWTNYLREAGVTVEGVEPVEAFVDDARVRYPQASYRVGRAEQLDVADESLGGVLAWFSLIHTPPEELEAPLVEFARCVRRGGSVALGFFEGAAGESFDHAVTTAYLWTVDALTVRLERAGFVVSDARTRQDAGVRRQGVIVACRV